MDAKNRANFGSNALMTAAALALIATASLPAHADDKAKEMTSIITSLEPTSGGGRGSAKAESVTVIIDKKPTKVLIDYGRAVDLTVFFRYNSARISSDARYQLNQLGRALTSRRLAPYRYLIAGHTDATGSDRYNLNLSVRRAASVRNYLYRNFGIRRSRLIVAGWGERRLKDRYRPRSGINRRVEVALVADGRPVAERPSVTHKSDGSVVVRAPEGSKVIVKVNDDAATSGKPSDAACPAGTKLVDPRDPEADIDDFKKLLTGSEPRCVADDSGSTTVIVTD